MEEQSRTPSRPHPGNWNLSSVVTIAAFKRVVGADPTRHDGIHPRDRIEDLIGIPLQRTVEDRLMMSYPVPQFSDTVQTTLHLGSLEWPPRKYLNEVVLS